MGRLRPGLLAVLLLPPYLALAWLGQAESHLPTLLTALAFAFAIYWFGMVEDRLRLGTKEVMFWGIALRLCLLPMDAGDDMHRYLWEAKILGQGFNPWTLAPDHETLAPLRDADWEKMNHRGLPTLYPPLAEGMFFLLARIQPSALFFKLAFVFLDLLGFLLLLAILRERQPPPGAGRPGNQAGHSGTRTVDSRIAAVYFLNPLLLFEIAGRGHFDSLTILCHLAFLWALGRGKGAWAPVFLGLGVLGKMVSLSLAPIFFLRIRPLRAGLFCLGVGAITVASFLLTGGVGSMGRFALEFRFNSVFPYALEILGGSLLSPTGRRLALLAMLALGVVLGLVRLRRASGERQALYFLGLALLFSPTLHPWYLLWALPFAALAMSRPWLLLTGTTLVTYAVYGRAYLTGVWQEIHWLRLPEFLPPLLLWVLAGRRAPDRLAANGPTSPPFTLSSPPTGPVRAIIPVLNEEKSIPLVLRAIPSLAQEVIVVDNGCTDATPRLARSMGATVVTEPERGYGAACLRGMARLGPETGVVVFLDGDYSDFPEEMVSLVEPILAGRADLVIGSRVLGRREKGALLPVAIFGNWLSTRLVKWGWGFAYTDLGPFRAIRRDSLDMLGMQDRNFGWTIEMQVKALTHGLRVMEVPVSYRNRVGKSKISGTFTGSIRAGFKILAVIGREWMRERRRDLT